MVTCDHLKLKIATFQLALSVASRFLRARSQYQILQLVLITALMIACKFIETEPPEMSTLHKISCNSFTSKGKHVKKIDFYRQEMLILN